MKTLILQLALIGFAIQTSGQNIFQKIYSVPGGESLTLGYIPYSVHQTADGGYIMTGSKGIGIEFSNTFLVKTDSKGEVIWSRIFNDGQGGYAVEQTNDGGYIIASSKALPSPYFSSDVLVIKTDSSGTIVWCKSYGTTNSLDYFCGASSIKETNDGGYILAGSTSAYGAGSVDVYLLKINSVGKLLWTKTFGGTSLDKCTSVQQTSDKGYILVGYTRSFGTGGYEDVYLIKTDSIGNHKWSFAYGGTQKDEGNFVEQTNDGGYIITGYTKSFSSNGYEDILVFKTDNGGNIQWAKTFGDNREDIGFCIRKSNDGGYIISGDREDSLRNDKDGILLKIDKDGKSQWATAFVDSFWNFNNYVEQTSDGGYILAAYSQTPKAQYAYLPKLIKADFEGNSGCFDSIVSYQAINRTLTKTLANTIQGTGGLTGNGIITQGDALLNDSVLCFTLNTPDIFLKANDLKIYPNPAENIFTVEVNAKMKNAQIEIFNVLGEKIYSGHLLGEQQKINCKNFSAEIYFVKVNDGQEQFNQKLIIQ